MESLITAVGAALDKGRAPEAVLIFQGEPSDGAESERYGVAAR